MGFFYPQYLRVHGTQMYIPLKPLFSRHKGIGVQFTDEPTGNLDGENAENVMDILKALNKEGKTIVLVTHDLKIANYADRIIHLEQGKIV